MPPTIMIVDDDEQILILVDILLRRQGYQVLKAPSPYIALELLESATLPDLILLDYMMPGINGIELCQRIRLLPQARDVTILMLSAVDNEEFTRESLQAGANGHIPKSEMHRHLLQVINNYLASARTG